MSHQTAELNRMMDRARARVAAMTPEERAAMNEAQRRSWVRGELMMEHPAMTAQKADALMDEALYGGPVRLPARPVRLRLSRRKGFNLQEHSRAVNGLEAVAVTRGPGRKWGNPWVIGDTFTSVDSLGRVYARREGMTAAEAVEKFRRRECPPHRSAEIIRELRGKNLACWCAPGAPCHADVLLELANKPACERV